MDIHYKSDFITEEEATLLENYYIDKVKKSKSVKFNNLEKYKSKPWDIVIQHHPLISKLKKRVDEVFNNLKCVNGYDNNEVVVHIFPNQSFVQKHIDSYSPIESMSPKDYCMTKMIIYIRKAKNGNDLFAHGKNLKPKVRQMITFNPSETTHWLDANNDPDDLSIVLVFTRITMKSTNWLANKIKEINNADN